MSEARPSESSGSSIDPMPYDPVDDSSKTRPYNPVEDPRREPTTDSPDESIPIDPPTNSGGGST